MGRNEDQFQTCITEKLKINAFRETGVPSKNKSSCMNTLLSYEPFSVFQDIEEENGIFLLIANGLYLNIKISVKLVFE